MRKQKALWISLGLAAVVPMAAAAYPVGGGVSGLAGGTLVLQNSAGAELTITADGPFTFPAEMILGTDYEITVRRQPLWQFCVVKQGSGKVTAPVTDIAVQCLPAVARVSTFAGTGVNGSADGRRSLASFSYPYGLAVDKNGGLIVTDSGTRLVRKVSSAGDVTTFAGGGAGGSHDGHGTAASFNDPIGVTLDSAGNVYVAEDIANRIRKISALGDVTTLAGNGTQLTQDGQGLAAMFNYPTAVAADAAGNIYVAEYFGAVVRKITPAGVVTTLAGSGAVGFADGKGRAAVFRNPFGIVVDPQGDLYIADRGNHRIRKITSDGVVTTLAGSGQVGATDGAGPKASFNFPSGLALDSDGNLYVADTENQLLRKITPRGQVTTLAGQPMQAGAQDGVGQAARFNKPFAIAADQLGDLYVTDSEGHLIRKVTPVPTQ